jgi:hypothetical protein
MVMHNYIYAETGDLWPAASVNARVPAVLVYDRAGNVILNKKGEEEYVFAAHWLDKYRYVQCITWAPGEPQLITGRLIRDGGGWQPRPDGRCFNLYNPPPAVIGDASAVDRWLDHARRIYPVGHDHMVTWFAHRVQRPGQKINHAPVMGGKAGIGKDTILEPLKRAVGHWNFREVSPVQIMGRFNGFLKAVVLRVSEARDLGEVDRYKLYEHMKAFEAAPPDKLRVDEKNRREYDIVNCCGIVYTTNHRTDGLYIPADDRRHFVDWSELSKDHFEPDYFPDFWRWYEEGGFRHVAAYLTELDISDFDPCAPPPKTDAFWAIVGAGRAPEESEISDALDKLDNPAAVTVAQIIGAAEPQLQSWLLDRKNCRAIPHRMEACGYTAILNHHRKDLCWQINGSRQTVYGKANLSMEERLKAAAALSESVYTY